MISALASIHPNAQLGAHVSIDPFSMIHENVVIGEGTKIHSNVALYPGTRIGKHCEIFPGAVIGVIPQDLKFEGEDTTVEIGDYTKIRECVTIHRATKDKWKTVIGSHCLLMTYVHVAHDCQIGNHVILASYTGLSGHVSTAIRPYWQTRIHWWGLTGSKRCASIYQSRSRTADICRSEFGGFKKKRIQ